MSYRSETKFRLSYGDHYLLKSNLISSGMKLLHPGRIVNSEYYDNEKLQMFCDSEEGILPRKKVRIRWYNNSSKKKLEVKISSIEGRFKTSNDLLQNTISSYKRDNYYGKIFPSVLVKYKREYYEFKDLRFTFDSSISYRNLRNQSMKIVNDKETVVEIKTSSLNIQDYISEFISCPTSRFSKYSRGIQQTKFI